MVDFNALYTCKTGTRLCYSTSG